MRNQHFMTLERFTTSHPFLSAFGFLVIVVTIVLGIGAVNEVFLMGSLIQVAVVDSVLAVTGIFFVFRLCWWKKAGYTAGIRWADVPLFVLPGAVALLSLSGGIRVTGSVTVLAFAVLTLVVGFAEETWFRGLILTALLPLGILRAAVISAFFFAAPHLLNSLGGTWDLTFTMVDTVAAFGLGLTFAALRLRTESIWPLVGIHTLFDFTSLVAVGGVEVHAQSLQVLISSVIVGAVFAAYGLFLLRGVTEGPPGHQIPEEGDAGQGQVISRVVPRDER
jgi:hypothetical protein